MKTNKSLTYLYLFGISLSLMVFLTNCEPTPTDSFAGRVVNVKNEGLAEAEVEINGTKTKTKQDGSFVLELKRSETKSFVVNARKDSFATCSKVIGAPRKDLVLTLYKATVVSVDPTQEIKVTDTNSKDRPGPPSAQANWVGNPMAAVPLVVRNNKIVDLGFPADFGKSFDYVLNRKPGEGISITIPANTLVSTDNQSAPSGNVNVAVSTIDIFSPGAMPGDYGVSREGREVGFLISYGAGFIDIYDSKSRYQLKKGASAQLTIPVDQSQLVYQESVPESIPLYLFDEKLGAWVDHGKAVLSADKKSYVGEVRHFSTFNVDMEINDPACLGFQHAPAAAVPAGFTYNVEVVAKRNGNFIHKTRTVTEPGDCLPSAEGTGAHVILRLPPDSDTGLIFLDASNNPLAIIVTQSSPRYDPLDPPVCTPAGYENTGAAVSCPSITWDVLTSDIIAVGVTNPTTSLQQIKWVFKNFTAGDTYRIVDATGACIANSTTTISTVNPLSTPLNAGTLSLEQVDMPAASAGTFRVQVIRSGAVLIESACVSF